MGEQYITIAVQQKKQQQNIEHGDKVAATYNWKQGLIDCHGDSDSGTAANADGDNSWNVKHEHAKEYDN